MGNYPQLPPRGHQFPLLWPGAADSPRTYHKGQCVVYRNRVSIPTHRQSQPKGLWVRRLQPQGHHIRMKGCSLPPVCGIDGRGASVPRWSSCPWNPM